MHIEYEATFCDIEKDAIRATLRDVGAVLITKEFLQKRVVFNLPSGHEIDGGWLRVRDEQDNITMSLKIVANNGRIEDQFESACEMLAMIGGEKKAYQENRRELWRLDGADITIDEWPYLEPFVEIEAESEKIVKRVAKKLGFDYRAAYFGSVDGLYATAYGISEDRINNHTPRIVFDMKKHPFID
jgi:adenylate cyclase, class 2